MTISTTKMTMTATTTTWALTTTTTVTTTAATPKVESGAEAAHAAGQTNASSSSSSNLPDSRVKSLYEISDDDQDEYELHIVENSGIEQQQQQQHSSESDSESFLPPASSLGNVAPFVRRYSSNSSPSSMIPNTSSSSSSASNSNWVSSPASLAALDALLSLSDVTVGKIVAAKEFPLEQVLSKGSAANKLLCSILYDVVKDISKICADLGCVSAKEGTAKEIFYALLEKFVKENFPSLLTTDLMFYEGSNRMSAIAYIRSKTRVMFFMRMKALAKKIDVASANALLM